MVSVMQSMRLDALLTHFLINLFLMNTFNLTKCLALLCTLTFFGFHYAFGQTFLFQRGTPGPTSFEVELEVTNAAIIYISTQSNGAFSGRSKPAGSYYFTVTGLVPGTTYYIYANVMGSNTPTISITTASLTPSAPSIYSAQQVGGTEYMARWSSVANATSYKLYVSKNSSFSSHISGYNGKTISGTSTFVRLLDPNTTYYYRVKTVSNGGTSEYSSYNSVTTVSKLFQLVIVHAP